MFTHSPGVLTCVYSEKYRPLNGAEIAPFAVDAGQAGLNRLPWKPNRIEFRYKHWLVKEICRGTILVLARALAVSCKPSAPYIAESLTDRTKYQRRVPECVFEFILGATPFRV